MSRIISPLLVGIAACVAAYYLASFQRPCPPRELRARYAAKLSLWCIGVAAIVALWPNLRPLFGSATSTLLVMIAAFALSTAKLIDRITLRGSASSWRSVVDLYEDFSAGKRPDAPVPVVVVEARGTIGEIYTAHILTFFSRMSDYRQKMPLYTFLPIGYLDSISHDFRDWVVRRADACLLIAGPESIDSINVGEKCSQCWGKKHIIAVHLFQKPEHQDNVCNMPNSDGLRIAIRHQMPYLNKAQEDKLTPISRDLFNCTGVVHREEQRLKELVPVIEQIRASAFQPIAKAYLTFRFSSSDTERLLGLFDCFETVIKTCVIIVVAVRRAAGIDLVADLFAKKPKKARLENLAIGDWLSILQRGIDTCDGTYEFQDELHKFWDVPLSHPFLSLIDTVNAIGISAEFEGPTSNAGWLAWMVRFRNCTRGHGMIREFSSHSIWPIFHECLLSLLKQIPNTVFGLKVFAESPDGLQPVSNGWPFSTSAECSSCGTNRVFLKLGEEMIGVAPFLYVEGGSLAMLSSRHGANFTYIDYLDGAVRKIPVGGSA